MFHHEILALKNAAFFIDEMNANPEPSHAFTRKDAFPLYSWLSALVDHSDQKGQCLIFTIFAIFLRPYLIILTPLSELY